MCEHGSRGGLIIICLISSVAYAPSLRFLRRKLEAYASYLSKGPKRPRALYCTPKATVMRSDGDVCANLRSLVREPTSRSVNKMGSLKIPKY